MAGVRPATATCPRRGTSGGATGSTSSTCCAGGSRRSRSSAIVAVNLTHLGAAGLPPVLGVALGAVALLVVLWSGHALVLSALFSFRTRDVARLGAYFVAGKPLVTLGFVSVLVLTGALAYASDWLLVLLAAPLTYLYARTAAPVVAAAEAQFTA